MADDLSYTLDVCGVSDNEAEAVAEFLIAVGASPPDRIMGFPLDGLYIYGVENRAAYFGKSDDTTWSEVWEHLREISAAYSAALFVLDTTGFEEEMSRTYFKGGRFYVVSSRIVYPDFDEAKLGYSIFPGRRKRRSAHSSEPGHPENPQGGKG